MTKGGLRGIRTSSVGMFVSSGILGLNIWVLLKTLQVTADSLPPSRARGTPDDS
jgi:hypothetical protein